MHSNSDLSEQALVLLNIHINDDDTQMFWCFGDVISVF